MASDILKLNKNYLFGFEKERKTFYLCPLLPASLLWVWIYWKNLIYNGWMHV